ncbi:hypothetical protein H9P43_007225 [Blastocladiella emersonii ATCC 22665]|nr:hypothetical protein H9P43_007225 [Blastocladiella emersonii ATCC 22665]
MAGDFRAVGKVGKGAMKGGRMVGKAGLGVFSDFKKFVARGNVIDLAVAVIIGAAFGAIVKSLVDDLFTPILALAGGNEALTFTEKFVVMKQGRTSNSTYTTRAQAKADGAITLDWGNFLTSVINFLIVSAALFLLIQVIAKIQRQKKVDDTEKCPFCLETIKKGAMRCKWCTSDVPRDPPELMAASDATLPASEIADDGAPLRK